MTRTVSCKILFYIFRPNDGRQAQNSANQKLQHKKLPPSSSGGHHQQQFPNIKHHQVIIEQFIQ